MDRRHLYKSSLSTSWAGTTTPPLLTPTAIDTNMGASSHTTEGGSVSEITCLESGQNQVGSIKGKERKRQDQKVGWGQKIEDYREIHLIKELTAQA